MPPIIDKNLCTGCGSCFDVCAEDVFYGSIKGDVPIITYPEECVHCNLCVDECSSPGAIKLRIPLPVMLVYKSS